MKTTETWTTRRDQLVRQVALSRGITMTQAAEEMGTSKGNLHMSLLSENPRPPTLERIRAWLNRHRKHLPGRGRPIASNSELLD